MSIRSLFEPNNYELHCRRINATNLDIGNFTIDNFTVNNALVLSTVTTPHITSGTTLFTTVDTIDLNSDNAHVANLNATNGTVGNLEITTAITSCPSATISSLNCGAANVTSAFIGTGTINTLTSNSITTVNLISTAIDTGTITADSGTIGILNGATLTYDGANLNGATIGGATITSLSCNDANIGSLTGTTINVDDVTCNTGHIGILSGSDITYDVGYFPTLSTRELTIFTSIVACPSATIDNLSVVNSVTSPNATIDNLNSTDINCNTLNGVTSVSSTLVKANNIGTVSGTGNLTFNNNVNSITFPSSGSFTSIPLSFCSFGTVIIPVSGNCISSPANITAYVARCGAMITMNIANYSFVSTGLSDAIKFALPTDMKPNSLSITPSGPCAFLTAFDRYIGMYELNGIGQLWLYNLNQPVGSPVTLFNKRNINQAGSSTPIFSAGTGFSMEALSITYIRQP